ncbi:MAG: hypothetical protein EXQ48_03270 [Acidobacteria bacterium]|nr:hypothetical protein [Acidobacteriota bacterium]
MSADRTLIENGVRTAQALFQGRFGRAVTGQTTVDVRAGSGPFVAQGQGHLMTIYAGDARWSAISSTGRTRTVVHEAFHILQGEVGWAVDPTQWLFEGAAEYVGYTGAIDAGNTTYATVRNCEIQIYFDGGGSATPPLETISFTLSSAVNSRYAVAWLAVDRLTNGLNGLDRLKGMWEAPGSWDQRFQTAFSTTPVAFYADFAAYGPTLTRAGANPCAAL